MLRIMLTDVQQNSFMKSIKQEAKNFLYLINSEGDLNWSILINFCHNTVRIRIDSICTNTIML
jgi:hypothetical protein